jgi:hypothetical protein
MNTFNFQPSTRSRRSSAPLITVTYNHHQPNPPPNALRRLCASYRVQLRLKLPEIASMMSHEQERLTSHYAIPHRSVKAWFEIKRS